MILTCDEGKRGGRNSPLKAFVDEAIQLCPPHLVQVGDPLLYITRLLSSYYCFLTLILQKVFVLKHTGAAVHMEAQRDVYMHDAMVNGTLLGVFY